MTALTAAEHGRRALPRLYVTQLVNTSLPLPMYKKGRKGAQVRAIHEVTIMQFGICLLLSCPMGQGRGVQMKGCLGVSMWCGLGRGVGGGGGGQDLTSTAVTAASVARMEGPRWLVTILRRGSPSPSAWGSMSSRWRRSSHSPADTPLLKMLGSS